jgi:putative (di)nucleoside polyphosphate hydrolase
MSNGHPAPAAHAQPLPLRTGVGILVFNDAGRIWTGKRRPRWASPSYPETWHMPQGGLHANEDPAAAALRELVEETGIRSAEIVSESDHWRTWELPVELQGIALKGRYRGQHQLWFAAHFTGDDGEISITAKPPKKAEFSAWRWSDPQDLIAHTFVYKQPLYRDVLAEFEPVLPDPDRQDYSTAVTV